MDKSNPLNLLEEVLNQLPQNSEFPTAKIILTVTDEGDGMRSDLCIRGDATERVFHIGVGIANQVSESLDQFMHHSLNNIDKNLDESPMEVEEIFKPNPPQQEGTNDDPQT